jgi:hypothetical protein
VGKQVTGVAGKQDTGLGQPDAPALSLDQPLTGLSFQPPDLL